MDLCNPRLVPLSKRFLIFTTYFPIFVKAFSLCLSSSVSFKICIQFLWTHSKLAHLFGSTSTATRFWSFSLGSSVVLFTYQTVKLKIQNDWIQKSIELIATSRWKWIIEIANLREYNNQHCFNHFISVVNRSHLFAEKFYYCLILQKCSEMEELEQIKMD